MTRIQVRLRDKFDFRPTGILDVGANKGHWTEEVRPDPVLVPLRFLLRFMLR